MLFELLRVAAAAAPDRVAIVTPNQSVTYEEWEARASAVARGLADREIERFGCIIGDPVATVVVLCAAARVGAEPCVYRATVEPELAVELADAMDHDTIVSDDGSREVGTAAVVTIDDLVVESGDLPPQADHSPITILTTGTTGRPKGARHDWSRLLAAVRRDSVPPDSRWLLAYNLNQFAGLQVFLHALAGQATLCIPPTNQPQTAIPFAIESHVTHVSATPTFWRFGLALLDDEKASALPLQQITLGGEAVPAAVLDQLRGRFPDARISQIYASTEAGSAVSVRDAQNGLPLSVLDRRDDADVQMRIVDGELQIRSRVGMLGYHGDESDDGGWYATGDLVEVRDDRIHFVGRTSEVINVGGVKVHPLPIEAAAQAVAGVLGVRAHGRPNAVTGQIVALDVVAEPGADRDDVESRLREAMGALPPAAQPRRIKFVDQLEVREQKVVRGA